MRAGDTLAKSLRSVIRDCKMGKLLIQTNDRTMEPELHYLRLPKNISQYKILLMDATVATGKKGEILKVNFNLNLDLIKIWIETLMVFTCNF